MIDFLCISCFNLNAMSRICEICGKGYLKSNLVPRGIGKRVTRRTISKQQPNLRTKRILAGSNHVTVKMCTSCLKKLKKDDVIPTYSKQSS